MGDIDRVGIHWVIWFEASFSAQYKLICCWLLKPLRAGAPAHHQKLSSASSLPKQKLKSVSMGKMWGLQQLKNGWLKPVSIGKHREDVSLQESRGQIILGRRNALTLNKRFKALKSVTSDTPGYVLHKTQHIQHVRNVRCWWKFTPTQDADLNVL